MPTPTDLHHHLHHHHSTTSSSGDTPVSSSVIIPPRSFNHLIFRADTVTKTSSSPALAGELFFYRHVPPSLMSFFPTLIHHTDAPVTLTITRVPGVTLSTLLTTGALKPRHVCMVLQSLHAMHSWKRVAHTSMLYMNHAPKVKARLKRSMELYDTLGLSNNDHFIPLLQHLHAYQSNKSALPVAVIHGDPVFTNILLPCPNSTSVNEEDDNNSNNNINDDHLKFIDMRGAQGHHLTLAGDAVYDLAKVFQSLLGYDFILADVPLTTQVVDSLADLLCMFWKMVAQLYPSVRPRHVVIVCAGLVTSLIPLHDNHRHRARFAVIATVLLQALKKEDEFDNTKPTTTTMTTTTTTKDSPIVQINDDNGAITLLHAIAHQVDACA